MDSKALARAFSVLFGWLAVIAAPAHAQEELAAQNSETPLTMAQKFRSMKHEAPDAVGVLSSQVGYDVGEAKRAVVRLMHRNDLSLAASFSLVNADGNKVFSAPLTYWGETWGSHWWTADFSEFEEPGRYALTVNDSWTQLDGDTVEIGASALWSKAHEPILSSLIARAEGTKTGLGWRDSGSELQEFSSHVVTVDGLIDMLELSSQTSWTGDRNQILQQISDGSSYLAFLQDRAAKLGLGDGAVVHEAEDEDVVTGNVAKAAMIFARASTSLKEFDPIQSAELLARAERAFAWIEANGPIVDPGPQLFYAPALGAPEGTRPPQQWMTRDLVTMMRASLYLAIAGQSEYQAKAASYAALVAARQVSQSDAEDGLYGHFYTYDDYSELGDYRFTENANIHAGAWSHDGRKYLKGAHYPHYLLPLIEMAELWPEHEDAASWRKVVENFAYGYFLPTSQRSPFGILPAGYYQGEGLLFFSSWYHAHNNMYAFAAVLGFEFETFLADRQFRDIAMANMQWVAGLNSGVLDREKEQYLAVSMIHGVGDRFRGSWTKIPGSICNGFSASMQFRFTPASAETDRPMYFDDEAYIAHSFPYLAALLRLQATKQ